MQKAREWQRACLSPSLVLVISFHLPSSLHFSPLHRTTAHHCYSLLHPPTSLDDFAPTILGGNPADHKDSDPEPLLTSFATSPMPRDLQILLNCPRDGYFRPGETITGGVVFRTKTTIAQPLSVTLESLSYSYYTTSNGQSSSTVSEPIHLFVPRTQHLISAPHTFEAGNYVPFSLVLPTTTEYNRPHYRRFLGQILSRGQRSRGRMTIFADKPHPLPPSFGRTGHYHPDGIGYTITARCKTRHALWHHHEKVSFPVTTSSATSTQAVGQVSTLDQAVKIPSPANGLMQGQAGDNMFHRTVAMAGGPLLMHISLPDNAWTPIRLLLSCAADTGSGVSELTVAQVELKVRSWRFVRVYSVVFKPQNHVLHKAHFLKLNNLRVSPDQPVLIADKQTFATFAPGMSTTSNA